MQTPGNQLHPVRLSILFAITFAVFKASHAAAAEQNTFPIRDKTLVAWALPADTIQRGGSVLTIEKPGGVFDGIVFGELTPAKWMAGSNEFRRTMKEQESFPKETANQEDPHQVAVVYSDHLISLYRDGVRFASYEISQPEVFGDDSIVLLGLRHLDAMPANRFFRGSIDDVRIYDQALTADQLLSLKRNSRTAPEPIAWWDFENGQPSDRMGLYPTATLFGDAGIDGGQLHLDGEGDFLMASSADAKDIFPDSSMDESIRAARTLREKLLRDPHRPGYHFVIPEGQAMPFDPNGAIFWKGRYHLFYIFQDERGHNWGHVSSTDLFHWRHHPTGLVSGMFSGNCFINKDGRPTMCYHQVGQGNAMAVAMDDELNTWKKLDSNPITPQTSPGDPFHDLYRSWDPYGWLEGDTYYAIFGGTRPAVVKSTRLDQGWEYVGDLMANAVEGVSINEDVSCADFFKLGNKHMLLCISHELGCRYYLGEWKDEQFHPEKHARMSWTDNSFFAPESLLDDRGRRIMWAWIFDRPGFQMRLEAGWSGTMGLPRVLSLDSDGVVHMNPPEEIEQLRYNHRSVPSVNLAADSEFELQGIQGDSMELILRWEPMAAQQLGIKVRCSPGGEEETLVFYDTTDQALKIDTTRSSLKEGPGSIEAGPLKLDAGEDLEIRVFLDKSVVEVFANGQQAVMRRIYPSLDESTGVILFTRGGAARMINGDAWQMMPANPY